ncbi:MAG: hypothetical protein ACN4GZ_13165 [Acidimicrobiales bacterium]
MLALFGEGLETAFFPCSLVLAVPGLAVAAGGRRFSAFAIAAFATGLLVSSWLRFAGATDLWPPIIVGSGFLVASFAIARLDAGRPSLAAGGAGAAAGAATGSLWRPCVGIEFGTVLNGMAGSGLRGGFELAVYIVGVMAPVIAVVAVANALPPAWIERASKPLMWLGGGVLVILGLATIAGFDDHVISRLFELSSF